MTDIQRLFGAVVGVTLLLIFRDFTLTDRVNADDSDAESSVTKRQRDIPKPNFNTAAIGPVLKFSFCYS